MNPLISVIMAVYNNEKYVDAAVRSVQCQTVKDWELLVVDDASTDRSVDRIIMLVAEDPRIRLLRMPANGGAGAARDAAILQAKGRFIAIADADDVCMPDRFEKQIRFLEANPRVIALGTQAIQIDKDGLPAGDKTFPTEPDALYQMMYTAIPIQLPSLIVNRLLLPEHFDWFEGWRYSEDSLLFFKLASHGLLANLPEPLVQYRFHAGSTSYKHAKTCFFATWESRRLARTKYGYKPTVRGRAVSGLQFVVVSLLPKYYIPVVYKAVRRVMLLLSGNS